MEKGMNRDRYKEKDKDRNRVRGSESVKDRGSVSRYKKEGQGQEQ